MQLTSSAELIAAQHELLVAEEAMDRLRDPDRSVRQREQRIGEQAERIKIIRSKIQVLQNPVPTLAAATILGSLSNDNRPSFTPVHINREVLNFVASQTGPGTEEVPMDIDDDDGSANDRVNHKGVE